MFRAGVTSKTTTCSRVAIPPAREQQRIVAKIDELFSELDAGVASLQRARALLKKYRQAVLKAAVTGELTRDWRERHKGEIRETGADLLQRILKARRATWEAAELKKLRAKGDRPRDDRWKQKYKEPHPPDTTEPARPAPRVGMGRWPASRPIAYDVSKGSIPVPKRSGYQAAKFTMGKHVYQGAFMSDQANTLETITRSGATKQFNYVCIQEELALIDWYIIRMNS